jgi:predicted metal-dependent peptidase
MKNDEKKSDVVLSASESIYLAKQKIDRVLAQLVFDDPIILNVFCLIDILPDKNQETLGISIKSRPPSLKFNPYFINTISKEHLELVIVQEGFKLLLRHPTTRFSTPRNVSSLASNITVNQLMQGSVNDLKTIQDILPTSDKFDLKNDGYYEEYFRYLMDDYETTKDKIKSIWNSMSDEEKKEALEKSMESMGGGESSEDGEKQEGEGSPDVSGGYKQFPDSKSAMKNHYDPNGKNNIEWDESELFDASIKNMVHEKAHSSKNWGKYTGNHVQEILSANTPKISVKEILRRFNRSVQASQVYSSRMKLNRRYGLESPGYRKEYKTKVLFAIDVSGSMSDNDIAEGLSLINSTCKNSELTFMTFDWDITKIEKKISRARKSFTINGRGGTNFQCVIDYANEKDFDGVIIYTDGYASEPTKLKKGKLLWLLANKEQNPPCSWGYVAKLNRYEN